MMKTLCRFFAAAVLLAALFGLCVMSASADEADMPAAEETDPFPALLEAIEGKTPTDSDESVGSPWAYYADEGLLCIQGMSSSPYDGYAAYAEDIRYVYILTTDESELTLSGFDTLTELESVKIDGPVSGIGNSAFYGCAKMTSVFLPDSVTVIWSNAFEDCTQLKSVRLPDSELTIYDNAFRNTGLTEIYLPAGVTFDSNIFIGCNDLRTITVSEDNPCLVSDGNCLIMMNGDEGTLLRGCADSVIPDYVTCIYREAFAEYDEAFTLTVPSSVTEIWSFAFSDCTGLESIVLPDSMTELPSYLFIGCTGLKTVHLPASLTAIPDGLFYDCESLTEVVLPAGVSKIGHDAFLGCESLTEVVLPAGVSKIGDDAFHGCESLTVLDIPASVTNLGRNAFAGCTGLTELTLPTMMDNLSNMFYSIVPSGLKKITILAGTALPYGAFANASGLEEIILPAGITVIPGEAFSNCSSLETIDIPEGVTSIGIAAFAGCTSLEELVIPDGVTNFDFTVIMGCTGLRRFVIPSYMTEIPDEAFMGCAKLKSLFIPASVTRVGSDALTDCVSLSALSFEEPDGWVCYDGVDWAEAGDLSDPAVAAALVRSIPYHAIFQRDTEVHIHTFENGVCTECGVLGFEVTSAALGIGSDMTMYFYANLHDEYKNAVMRFTMNGESVTVAGERNEYGETVFAFTGILPQCMNDDITAELLLDGEVIETVKAVSVVDYCRALLENGWDYYLDPDGFIWELMNDLLEYGAAAQEYLNYETDELAHIDELAYYKASYADYDPADDGVKSVGEKFSTTAYFTSAGLAFGYRNQFYLRLRADDVSLVTVLIDGEEAELLPAEDGLYMVLTPALSALELDKPFTVELLENGETVQTVVYSVNAYCAAIQASDRASDGIKKLAKALYNYGLSSRDFSDFVKEQIEQVFYFEDDYRFTVRLHYDTFNW